MLSPFHYFQEHHFPIHLFHTVLICMATIAQIFACVLLLAFPAIMLRHSDMEVVTGMQAEKAVVPHCFCRVLLSKYGKKNIIIHLNFIVTLSQD